MQYSHLVLKKSTQLTHNWLFVGLKETNLAQCTYLFVSSFHRRSWSLGKHLHTWTSFFGNKDYTAVTSPFINHPSQHSLWRQLIKCGCSSLSLCFSICLSHSIYLFISLSLIQDNLYLQITVLHSKAH